MTERGTAMRDPPELSAAPSDETFPVHDRPGDEIPGEEPRPIGIDALPFR